MLAGDQPQKAACLSCPQAGRRRPGSAQAPGIPAACLPACQPGRSLRRCRSRIQPCSRRCEHLASAAAALAADILRGCPGVRILATSQQPLGMGGEQVFRLQPLSLPPAEAGMACRRRQRRGVLVRAAGCRRARDFSLSPANVAAVGEICRRLDRITLAIELAAARAAALRPAEIAGLLDERFRLLTRGRADAADRQRTLQATVEWSYALLGEADRRVLGCLGAFPASFDAAAAAVAGAADPQQWGVLDSLTDLVGKSMVAEEEGPDQTSRYRLLETMRAYARQQLAAGELGRLRHRHAEHYTELNNLQAAITWSLADGVQARPLAFWIVAARRRRRDDVRVKLLSTDTWGGAGIGCMSSSRQATGATGLL